MDQSTERAGKTLDEAAEANVKAAIERMAEDLSEARGADVRIARELGFYQQHINRIRRHGARIGMDLARAVAKYFGVRPAVLLEYGPPPPVLHNVLRTHSTRWSPEIVSYAIALSRSVDLEAFYDWQWEELLNGLQRAHTGRLKKLRAR